MIGAIAKLERPARVLLMPAILVLVVVAWANMRLLPHWEWSACRLAASIRIAYGFPLYAPPDGVVLNDWMYGPIAPLAYLPAALMTSPLGALRMATVLNAVYFLLPLTVLLAPHFRMRETRLVAAWTFVFGLTALLLPFAVWYGAAVLHVDTVANCLGILSCVTLVRWRRPWLSASLWALAIWTKQTVVPLALAHVMFVAWEAGWRASTRQGLRLLATGAVVSAVCCGWFGFTTLWHNLVEIPSRYGINWSELGRQVPVALGPTWWIVPVAVTAWLFIPPRRDSANGSEARLGWLLLFAAAILAPLDIVSMLKVGGGQNSLHLLTYAILGAVVLGAALIESRHQRVAASAFVAMVAGGCGMLAIKCTRAFTNGYLTPAMSGEQRDAAFAFAQAHPGQTYFPCDPLVNLMADRCDYATAPGYHDWQLVNAAPSRTAMRRQFPDSLRYIIYDREDDPPEEVLALFPDFTQHRAVGSWWIYTRGWLPPSPANPGSSEPR